MNAGLKMADRLMPVPPIMIDISIYDAFGYFKNFKEYSSFPVVNMDKKPIGILLERTFKDYTYGMFGRELLKRCALAEFITPHVQINADAGEEEVLSIYANNAGIDGIVAVDGEGRYMGMLQIDKLVEIYEENRRLINRQLVQTQKMEAIGTLAGGIAHDFNNILMPIMGYAELIRLLCGHENNDRLNNCVEQILQATGRARDLVKQILTFSRQNEQTRSVFKLSLIIKEALRLLRASLPSTIAIDCNFGLKDDFVFADPTQIHQILMNLLTNAAYAINGNNGKLWINLTAPESLEIPGWSEQKELPNAEFVRLTISDSAGGLDPAIIHRIFEPFFTTKPQGQGTGLGLSVVHGIVKSHDGYIAVESDIGKRTSFHIFLPLHRHGITEAGGEDSVKTKVKGGGIRVLFIDDEAVIAELMQESLEQMGFKVESCTNSLEAFNLFAARPDAFDVIVTDQTMPGLTGAEIARRMLALRPILPIILCTGFSEQVTAERAKVIGIKEYLLKPVLAETLARRIHACLAGRN